MKIDKQVQKNCISRIKEIAIKEGVAIVSKDGKLIAYWSSADLSALYDDIMRRTNNGIEILFKMD